MNQRLILTPAPGAVFLRASSSVVEMTPGEALRFLTELQEVVRVALAAEDGRALRAMIGAPHA